MHPEERVEASYEVDPEGLAPLAETLLRLAGTVRVWLFFGEMGSGKTTLIKAICAVLGVKDVVTSPSYSIVNEYPLGEGKVYHFDFYRIRNEQEAFDIGAEDYFYSGAHCFVEWPDKIPSLIPSAHVNINIRSDDNKQRTIAISIHDGETQTGF